MQRVVAMLQFVVMQRGVAMQQVVVILLLVAMQHGVAIQQAVVAVQQAIAIWQLLQCGRLILSSSAARSVAGSERKSAVQDRSAQCTLQK